MGSTVGCMSAEESACENTLVPNSTERASWCTNEPCIIKPEDTIWLSSFKTGWKDDEELSIVMTESRQTEIFSKYSVDDDTKAESLYYPHSDCDSVQSTDEYHRDRSLVMTPRAGSKSFSISRVSSLSRLLSQQKKSLKVLRSPTSITSQSSLTRMYILKPKTLWSLNSNDPRSVESASDSLICDGEDNSAKRLPSQLNEIQADLSSKSRRENYQGITTLNKIQSEEKTNSHFTETNGTCLLSVEKKKNPWKFFETIMTFLNEAANCFDTLDTLEFDVMRVAELPEPFNTMPLATTTVAVLHRMKTVELLKISWLPIVKFLMKLEEAYYDHPYHSSWHAADVVATTAYFISRGWFKKSLNPVHQITALLAAASHDVGHDALNNKYHQLVRSPIGTLYASSNLEQHHIAKATEIRNMHECDWTISLQSYNRTWTPEKVWELFSNMILGTDLSFHFPQKRRPFASLTDGADDLISTAQEYAIVEILHLADISNAIKPLGIAKRWAERWYQEFMEIGIKVRSLGLDIPIHKDPLKTPTLPESQIFFISNIALHAFEDLVSFMPEVQETLDNLHRNLEYWEIEKEGKLRRIKLCVDLKMDVSHVTQPASPLVGVQSPDSQDLNLESARIKFKAPNLGLSLSITEK